MPPHSPDLDRLRLTPPSYLYPLWVYSCLMSEVLEVQGMSCGHCVSSITSAVEPLPGVTGVEVDLEAGTVRVDGEADRTAVAAAIEDAGYDVVQSA